MSEAIFLKSVKYADGSYPLDAGIWLGSVPLTKAAALVLAGRDDVTNKECYVYALDSNNVYAVYNHDGAYSAMRASRVDYDAWFALSARPTERHYDKREASDD